jgi:peptide/nickel transport system ATP-binding protein
VVEMGATEKVFGNPLHPYTKMLLGSVPQLHDKWRELGTPGEALAEIERPPSPDAALVEVEDDHLVLS